MQAIGASGIFPAECKAFVKEYVPQILHALQILPPDQVHNPTPSPPILIPAHQVFDPLGTLQGHEVKSCGITRSWEHLPSRPMLQGLPSH